MIKRVVFASLCFFMLAGCVEVAFGQDPPPGGNAAWVGKVHSLRVIKQTDKNYLIIVKMVEDLSDGKFEFFDEASVILTDVNKDGQKVEIILDSISPGTFRKYKIQGADFINQMKVVGSDGSVSHPGFQLTKSGKKVESTKLIITTSQKVKFQLLHVSKRDTSRIQATFMVTTDLNGNIPVQKTPDVKNSLELKASDFENVPPPLQLLPGNASEVLKKKMEELGKIPAESFVTIFYPVQFSDPDRLSNLLRHKLSSLGTINVDNDTSILIITDQVRYVQSIVQALSYVDRRAPQLQIEVRIIEVSWDSNLKTGVDWSFLKEDDNDVLGGSLTSEEDDFLSGPGGVYSVFSRVSGGALKKLAFKLNLLVKSGQAEILARPKIVVMNNRTATLKAGARIPYMHWSTGDQSFDDQSRANRTYKQGTYDTNRSRATRNSYDGYDDTTDATSNTTSKPPYAIVPLRRTRSTNDDYTEYYSDLRKDDTRFSEQFLRKYGTDRYREDFIQTGINLTVTPRVMNSQDIIMKVIPSYDEITGYSRTNTPVISNRSFNSEVRVRNGDTIVIAGLIREKNLRQEKGIPGLRRVPLLGHLFKGKKNQKIKTEVLFILTPRIVK